MQYEEAIQTIEPGMYQHFKGNYYEVLCIARHSETSGPMVVYRALYGDGGVWVRPADMWNETVERDGHTFARFRKVSQAERVSFYEALFDEVSAAGDSRTNEIISVAGDSRTNEKVSAAGDSRDAISSASDIEQKLRLLEAYYTSGQWREDYEADEQGLLPEDLKRGVLSQDALYDLLG